MSAPASVVAAAASDLSARVSASRRLTRTEIVDATARIIARRGDHRLRWAAVVYEAGNAQAVLACEWFEDLSELIDECYARSARGLNEALLCAETAPGTAIDQVAAFLVCALEMRRARGVFLSFRRGTDLPSPLQRRLHEHDSSVRMRLKRLLNKGRRDGSLALRNPDSAVELLLGALQVPTVVVEGAEQRMWDSELVELLLAALAEPHPAESEPMHTAALIHGTCLCGVVRYAVEGSFELLSHCRCPLCRAHRGTTMPSLIAVPASGFRWLAGAESIATFHSSQHGERAFCTRCGAALPVADATTGLVLCPGGVGKKA
ncbi:MAG TPA: GFA family protein [Steroidobacteraceae bacterium]